MSNERPRAICLLSGGLDSATAAAIAKARGFEIHALTVDYGQRHKRELDAARAVAAFLGVQEHVVLSVDLRRWGGSALTDDIEVPLSGVGSPPAGSATTDSPPVGSATADSPPVGRATVLGCTQNIPITYVPARNTVLLALALSFAEARGAEHIFIGANQIDYSGYPDCREEFIDAFEKLASLATRAGVEKKARFSIEAPLLHMKKADIVREGLRLGLDYSLTYSCYRGAPKPCGACDSCRLRQAAFDEVGIPDPANPAR